MRTRLALTGSLTAIAAIVACAIMFAAPGSAQNGKTIFVVSKYTDTSIHFMDAPPKSPTGQPDHTSPGDVILQTAPLRNSAGREIGHAYSELTFFTASGNTGSVVLERSVYVFADGQITAESAQGPTLPGGVAITGGTGAYAGARGTVTFSDNDKKRQTEQTIRLLP